MDASIAAGVQIISDLYEAERLVLGVLVLTALQIDLEGADGAVRVGIEQAKAGRKAKIDYSSDVLLLLSQEPSRLPRPLSEHNLRLRPRPFRYPHLLLGKLV